MTSKDARAGQLVRVPLPRDTDLDGAWYPPAQGGDVAILHLHGKGGNFYSGPGRFVPELDHTARYGHLSLNMRCHDLGYTRGGVDHPDPHDGHVAVGGGMWEVIADGHRDVAAGVDWLRDRGASEVFVAGHSSGGFYAAQACASGVDVSGIVMLSPVISHRRHMQQWFAGDTAASVVAEAERRCSRGEGHVLFPVRTWYYAISAASLVERWREPDRQLARQLAHCRRPVMLLCGGLERRVPDWRAIVDELHGVPTRWRVVADVDHSYRGAEDDVARAIFDFVGEHTGVAEDR